MMSADHDIFNEPLEVKQQQSCPQICAFIKFVKTIVKASIARANEIDSTKKNLTNSSATNQCCCTPLKHSCPLNCLLSISLSIFSFSLLVGACLQNCVQLPDLHPSASQVAFGKADTLGYKIDFKFFLFVKRREEDDSYHMSCFKNIL